MKMRLHYAYENVVGLVEPVEFDASDIEELEYHLEWLELLHGPAGLHALAEIGEAGRPAVLQFALDVGGQTDGRAVLRWLPTGEFGHDPRTPTPPSDTAFDGSLIASAGDVLIFSPTASRLTPQQVKDAVVEYAATRARPTRIHWIKGSASMTRTA